MQRYHVDTLNRTDWNFINETNDSFSNLRKTLDGQLKQLQRECLGHVKGADTITDEDEKNFGNQKS